MYKCLILLVALVLAGCGLNDPSGYRVTVKNNLSEADYEDALVCNSYGGYIAAIPSGSEAVITASGTIRITICAILSYNADKEKRYTITSDTVITLQ